VLDYFCGLAFTEISSFVFHEVFFLYYPKKMVCSGFGVFKIRDRLQKGCGIIVIVAGTFDSPRPNG
jgi:hypothetical protein